MSRFFVVLLCGCSTTATFKLRDQSRVEATVVGGDARHLLLQDGRGVERVIERREVADIDQPGNVHAVVGGVMMLAGTANLVFSTLTCRNDPACIFNTVANGTLAAFGAGMLVWGLWAWLDARARVMATVPPLPESMTWVLRLTGASAGRLVER